MSKNKSETTNDEANQKVHQSFIDMICPLLPDENEREMFLEGIKMPLKKSITINVAKIDVEAFITMTKPLGWTLTPHSFSENQITFYIDRDDLELALGRTFLYQAGFFYIQEVAASMPAPLLDSKPGDIILDVCAAPGGKTSQLANRLLATGQNPGMVIANDIASQRIQTLAHNLNMQGCYNTALTKFNGFMFGKHLPDFFDHILVDAPCSGEGTGFKSDHALKFWRKEDINNISGTQFQILISSIKATKVGGTIIYSTCTLNPYENEGILARILEFFDGAVELEQVELINCEEGINIGEDGREFKQGSLVRRFWPHRQKTGGFFVSKLRKVGNTTKRPADKQHKLLPINQFKLIMHKKLQKEIADFMRITYGISPDPARHFFIASKEKVYVTSPAFEKIQPHIHCEKVGTPIFKIDKKTGYRPTHYFGLIFGSHARKNFIEFDDEMMQEYSSGKDIDTEHQLPQGAADYQIIVRNGFGMSVTKKVGNHRKNKFGK